MLVVAVQFYERDWYKSMQLVRLLADLAGRRRDDVALLFVRTSECPTSRVLDDAIARSAEVFHVESVVLRPDTPERRARWGLLSKWPVGCDVLWSGAASYFLRNMDPRWTTLFTVDGGDGVPLYRDWADLLVDDHAQTLRAGLQVTGCVLRDGVGRWHVNGNVVLERTFIHDHPEVLVMPDLTTGEAWDVHHARSFLSVCRGSSAVHCNWRQFGLRPEYFTRVAETAVWWHGMKDGCLVEQAGVFIASTPFNRRPALLDYGPAPALIAGGEHRDLQ